jgi:hypothetical protein
VGRCEIFYCTQHLAKGPEINFQKDGFAYAAKSPLNSVMESRMSKWIASKGNNLWKPQNEYLTVVIIDSTTGNIFLINEEVKYIFYSFNAKADC